MSETKNKNTRTVPVRVYCQAYYESSIEVPNDIADNEEALLEYVKNHTPDIPLTGLNYIPDSDEIDDECWRLG